MPILNLKIWFLLNKFECIEAKVLYFSNENKFCSVFPKGLYSKKLILRKNILCDSKVI